MRNETQQEYSRHICLGDGTMVYKYIDIVGTSKTVITDAINNVFEEASKTQEYKVGRASARDF
jgi:hypothetical protein